MSKLSVLIALALACSSKSEPSATPPETPADPVVEPAEPAEPAEPETTERGGTEAEGPATPEAPENTEATEVSLPDEVEVSDENLRALGRATNTFGLDLYKRLPRTGNAVMSPASISLALTMTWAGARGDTATEMARTLSIASMNADDVHAANAATLRSLNGQTAIQLRAVNRLFGEQTYTFEPVYLDLGRRFYAAPLEPVSFRTNADGARTHINDWIAGQTADRIQNLLPPGAVTADTSLVLTNAIYLLANWKTQFDTNRTTPDEFHVDASSAPTVPTMHRTGTFSYGEADGVQLLELPYVGDQLSMLVVLPRDQQGLGAVESRLDPQALERWVGALRETEDLPVSLPKFRIEPGDPVSLRAHLTAMGMNLAFDAGRADFTGMANPSDAQQRLSISDAFHKAFVRVDEQGTEAAAATAVVMVRGGRLEPVREFRADHPFLFAIRDLRTGMLLFVGRVVDPR